MSVHSPSGDGGNLSEPGFGGIIRLGIENLKFENRNSKYKIQKLNLKYVSNSKQTCKLPFR